MQDKSTHLYLIIFTFVGLTFLFYEQCQQSTIQFMDQRVFYNLLERVGGNGRYQNVALVIWSMLMFFIGSTYFLLPFVFFQTDYQCPQGYSNCKEYVCTLPHSERGQFIHDNLYTIPEHFGDFRCDSNVEIDWLQSFIYLGGVFGVLVGAIINELITKKMLIVYTVIGNIIGIGLALFGTSLLLCSIGLFISFASCSIELEIIQCFLIETVQQEVRAKQISISYISYSLGVTMNGLFFYWLKSYVTYFIILMPVLFACLIVLLYYIQETPFDAIVSYSPEESFLVLCRMAAANDRENEHKITLLEIEDIKREYQENEAKNDHGTITIIDLVRFDSLRKLTIVSFILHYVVSFQFQAPQMAIRDYSLDIYTSGFVMGFASLVASALCYFILDTYKRKLTIYITQAICIVTSVSVVLFFSCEDKHCSMQVSIMKTVGLIIFRFASTVGYAFFNTMQYQAFPNQIRGIALQFVCLPSFFAAVNIPQMLTFCETEGISVVFSFILCSVIIVVMMTCLPETYGIPPPEMIEELKYEHHSLVDSKAQEKIKET